MKWDAALFCKHLFQCCMQYSLFFNCSSLMVCWNGLICHEFTCRSTEWVVFSSAFLTNYLFGLAKNFTVHFHSSLNFLISKDEGVDDLITFLSIDKMRNDQSASFPICFYYLIACIQSFQERIIHSKTISFTSTCYALNTTLSAVCFVL